jgi:predicted kinase
MPQPRSNRRHRPRANVGGLIEGNAPENVPMTTDTPALLHLVAGATGAGKTTYARVLSDRLGALHLAIDDWMSILFGPDQPATPDLAWMFARTGRCEAQMWRLISQSARLGIPVVADCGFTRREHRARWREQAADAGISVVLHHLDIPAEVRWQRVARRNEEKGASFSFVVTRTMFDFIEGIWEPPESQELEAFASIFRLR